MGMMVIGTFDQSSPKSKYKLNHTKRNTEAPLNTWYKNTNTDDPLLPDTEAELLRLTFPTSPDFGFVERPRGCNYFRNQFLEIIFLEISLAAKSIFFDDINWSLIVHVAENYLGNVMFFLHLWFFLCHNLGSTMWSEKLNSHDSLVDCLQIISFV